MVKYTLHYFDARGRAEFIRFAFAQAGVPFDDHRIAREDWPKVKETMPAGQVPVLEVDGQKINQSPSILRYVGREFGLDGKTSWDKALVDVHCENVVDFQTAFTPTMRLKFAGDEAGYKAGVAKFLSENWPAVAAKYEKAVQTKSGFLVGDSCTIADLVVAEMLERFNTKLCPGAGALKSYPNLTAYVERIHALPNIKKYVASRPDTAM